MPAKAADLPDILDLQYLAYQSEAKLLNNFSIPPLQEKLEALTETFLHGVFLKAVDNNGLVVGSVRGQKKDDTLLIGKLMVRPDFQGQGIGSALLEAIEQVCPMPRFELFTSDKSLKNLKLYMRCGYVAFREQFQGAGLKLIYLEKTR